MMEIFDGIWFCFLLLGIFLFCYPKIYSKKNHNDPVKKKKENPHFAVLIPARNESKVIAGLLESIQNQTYSISMEDVYVIVENKNDPTISITHHYGSKILFRKDLSLKRKGYALDEAFEKILKSGKQYDAYFIFDADNILSSTYFEKMLKTYQDGYDIGVGYRNSKNGNKNEITASCALTFSMINTLGNKSKNRNHGNVVVSGTGFYITADWIQRWNGYPFHSLTEDYELYLYSVLHGMTSYYNQEAIFYDEQPTKWSQTIFQRTRWIKGFFMARKIYIPKIRKSIKQGKNKGSKILEWIGIKPYLFLVIGILGLWMSHLLYGIFLLLQNQMVGVRHLLFSFFILLFVYFFLAMFTAYLIHRETYLNLKWNTKIKAFFYNPLFLASYVICLFKAMVNKEIAWVPIEHVEEKIETT